MSVALCPHLSLEHFRGGEKWVAELANALVADGVAVAVHALPYAPNGERRVGVREVLDDRVPYREAWRHDLSGYDTAYVFYNPFSKAFFHGAERTIAGIHSWAYVSNRLFEAHYGIVPTAVKVCYRLVGRRELRGFDAVHSVTPAYDSPHPNTISIPNFVDTDRFHPDRAPLAEEFTVLTTAAHIPEKGWDTIRAVAARLADRAALGTQNPIRVVTTGEGTGVIDGLGFLSEGELAEAYARAHVVCHPARVDTDSMVLNEACASGTPVVTTPIATHVRENEAVLHGRTIEELCSHIERLRYEWATNEGYEQRCRRARTEGEAHSTERIYPQLKGLLVADADTALEPGFEPTVVEPATETPEERA